MLGNFGAEPNPPHSRSKARTRADTVAGTIASGGRSLAAFMRVVCEIDSRSGPMFLTSSSRRVAHASLTAAINWRNVGFGKYVPP